LPFFTSFDSTAPLETRFVKRSSPSTRNIVVKQHMPRLRAQIKSIGCAKHVDENSKEINPVKFLTICIGPNYWTNLQ